MDKAKANFILMIVQIGIMGLLIVMLVGFAAEVLLHIKPKEVKYSKRKLIGNPALELVKITKFIPAEKTDMGNGVYKLQMITVVDDAKGMRHFITEYGARCTEPIPGQYALMEITKWYGIHGNEVHQRKLLKILTEEEINKL